MLHSTAFHSYKNLSILQNKLFQQYWYVEIERIQNKCSESYDKYEILIKIITSICLFSVGALIVYFVGVGLVKIFSSFFNYT